MMNRNHKIRARVIRHFHCFFRTAMASDPGVVTANRQDGDIHAVAQFPERSRECCVATEQDSSAAPLKKVPVVTAMIVCLESRAPMSNRKSSDKQGTLLRLQVAAASPSKLGDLAQARPAQQVGCIQRAYNFGAFAKTVQRSHIKVIEMSVREQN